MEISKPHKPKAIPKGPGAGKKSELRLAVEAMEPSTAITISNAEQSRQWIYGICHAVGRHYTPNRSYTCNKIGDGVYQITRLA